MGRMHAEEMAELCDLDTALEWHFTANHYPPLPLFLLPMAKEAIAAANEGDGDRLISLPSGVTHRKYGVQVPTWVIIEEFHLDSFLDYE
jgi:hypothetical protein